MAKKILIVEDDENVYNFMEPFLADKGYNVKVSRNGKEGLRMVKEFSPDLVILDLIMPLIDGYDFLKLLYGSGAASLPKVIVLSGIDKMDSVEDALRLGASAYLLKPIQHHRVIQKVKDVLGE